MATGCCSQRDYDSWFAAGNGCLWCCDHGEMQPSGHLLRLASANTKCDDSELGCCRGAWVHVLQLKGYVTDAALATSCAHAQPSVPLLITFSNSDVGRTCMCNTGVERD